MRITPHSHRDAYSLVEVIISLGIFSIVILGILGSLGHGRVMSDKSTKQAKADFYLRTETESIRSLNWSSLDTYFDQITAHSASAKTPYDIPSGIQPATLAAQNFEYSVIADELSSAGEADKYIFKLSLSWADMNGRPHSESRVLVVAEGGINDD